MRYNSESELLITSRIEGVYHSSVYNQYEKLAFKRRLEESIKSIVKERNLYLDYENAVEEIINLCPLYLNFLASRNYTNVLFVGYYDAGKIDWMREYGSDSYYDEIPANKKTFMDYNTLFQFLPIVCKEWGYNIDFKVLKPIESKHTILMHDLYEIFIPNHIEKVGKQYTHGKKPAITNHGYEAIVFLGVPNFSTVEEIKKNWDGFGRHYIEYIDLFYEEEKRFTNSKDISPEIAVAMSTRSQWDYSSRVSDVSIDYKILEKTINIL